MIRTGCLLGLVVLLSLPANSDAEAWTKLAEPPKDLAGRESPPGSDGAWVYVPEWKGFLLHGGCMPTLSNEGWFFDPDQKSWTLLWAHDELARDVKNGWRVLLPREITWSVDRPGPARGQGAVYDPDHKKVYLFGGHPTVDHSRNFGPDPRLTRESWLGPAKLGTWELDPATGTFQHITDSGPTGLSRGVYDPVNRVVVAMPQRKNITEAAKDQPGVTWIYDPKQGKWETRTGANGPRAFAYSGLVYDARINKCVYYNGYGETWTYDAGSNAWTDMKPTQSPPQRRHAAFCYDETRGVSILQGGVHHPRSGPEAFSIHASHNGIHHTDTWAYNAAKNEWTELKPTTSPPKASSSRWLAGYDSDRKTVVLYDVAVGAWSFGSAAGSVKSSLPSTVVRPAAKAQPIPADSAVLAWQAKLRNLPDNTWIDLGLPVPAQGCKNISYDPFHHCLVMLGGCGGPLFPTSDDQGYNNQVWLLDMEVGKYALRRSHHVWGPLEQEFRLTRMGPGCTRGTCFDSVRNVLWTSGGNGWSGVGTTHIQSYDVASDRFSLAGPAAPWNDGECGMFVHDAKHDLLVYTDGRRHQKTYIYDPKNKTWTDGGPVPLSIEETLSMFSSRVYDPELGVIAIIPGWKDWKMGDPKPKGQPLDQLMMRTFAYDVVKKQWRDLAPANQEKVPFSGMPGVAYDSRNRAILLVKSDHGDIKPLDPSVPYGTQWVLDLATNRWKEAAPGPKHKLHMASMAYDARYNLMICRVAHNGFWAYRYKGGCPADAFTK